MLETPEITRALVRRWRQLFRTGLVAAVLGAGLATVLPRPFEATTVLLPPDRRVDDFRYPQNRKAHGFRRLLESFRLKDRTHPIEVYRAVLAGDELARRLVDRFDLVEAWQTRTADDAVRRLRRGLSTEHVPYGGIEIRVATSDPELSAELANAAASILEERLIELYENDVAWERGFLDETLREALDEAYRLDADLAEFRASEGLVGTEDETESLVELTRDLAVQIAEARTWRAHAARLYGARSGAALDAARRVEELERAVRSIPKIASRQTAARQREESAERMDEIREFLVTLRNHTYVHQAARATGVRVLDPAIPPEHGDLTTIVWAALLGLLGPSLVVVARTIRPSLAAGIGPIDRDTKEGRILGRGIDALDRVLDPTPRPGRSHELVLTVLIAAAAVLSVRFPLVPVVGLGLVFLGTVAANLTAAWLVLVAALPWAYDWLNRGQGYEIQLPTEPGIILFALAWLYSILWRGRLTIPRSPLILVTVASIVWIALAAIPSMHLRQSLMQLVAITGFILGGTMYPIFEIRRTETIERVLRIYLVTGAVLSIYGLVQVLRSPLPFDRAAFFIGEGVLYNHGPFAAYLGFGLGPALVYLFEDPKARRSPLVLSATVLMSIATVVSLTRAAWIAIAALLVVFGIVRARRFLRTLGVPIAITLVLLFGVFLRSPAVHEQFQAYLERSVSTRYGSNLERLNRWRAAVRMVADRPITGVGPSAYEAAYPRYRDATFASGQSTRKMGAHSDLLRAASEQGLPGLLLLVAVVVVFYRMGIRLMRHGADQRTRVLAAAICAGVFTYSIHGLFNEYWRLPKICLTLWIFVGLLGALDQIDRTRRRDGAPEVAGQVAI